MKVVITLCVFAFIALSAGYKECEKGTHAYTTGCGYLTPEATCDNPHPVEDRRGQICDYSACYCDAPTVRNTISGRCVKLEECPKKED